MKEEEEDGGNDDKVKDLKKSRTMKTTGKTAFPIFYIM